MTADDDSSRAVWLGEEGALAGAPAAGALVIECSTLSHDWVLELATQARDRGLRYVDSPVTGLPDAAAAGRLTLLVESVVFTPAPRLKDIDYALRLARKMGADCPFGEVAARLYRQLCDRGFAAENESRIIDA